MRRSTIFLVFGFFVIFVTSCTAGSEIQVVEETAVMTRMVESTELPATSTALAPTTTHTARPSPTHTRTIPTQTKQPSATPTETITPTPAQTPVGGGLGKIAYRVLLPGDNLQNNRGEIRLIGTDGIGPTKIYDGYSQELQLSKDGRYLAFSTGKNICRIELLTLEKVCQSGSYMVSLSPNGENIYFRARSSKPGTVVKNFFGNKTENIRTPGEMCQMGNPWSPTSEEVIFCSKDKQYGYLRLFNLKTKQTTEVSKDRAGFYTPVFSPDGNMIAYRNNVGNMVFEIFIVKPDGSGKKQITYENSRTGPIYWSPDGKKIAYLLPETMAGCRGMIKIFDFETKKSMIVNSKRVCESFTWTPDSSRIIFCADPDGNDLFGLFSYPVEDKEVSALEEETGGRCAPAWQP